MSFEFDHVFLFLIPPIFVVDVPGPGHDPHQGDPQLHPNGAGLDRGQRRGLAPAEDVGGQVTQGRAGRQVPQAAGGEHAAQEACVQAGGEDQEAGNETYQSDLREEEDGGRFWRSR